MIKLSLPIDNKNEVDQVIGARCSAEAIIPELVFEQDVRQPSAYNRFKDLNVKENFRKKLLENLHEKFIQEFNKDKADVLIKELRKLIESFNKDGAVIFGNMINIDNFQKLINKYTDRLSIDGSKSWIHSYINFGNHPDFLNDEDFNQAFIHPLLIVLISYSAGGPIRIVDARGKDAEPLTVQAQDNMLHIDNTPFRKEYKIILTWERGQPSGPKGQNFVFIPGTQKLVRNCKVSLDNKAWSTEDGSIFTSKKAVQDIFDMQKKVFDHSPSVVEATHPTMPLTTIFEAGALVHHRYRVKEKNVPRSCIIIAFHRIQDNPGQFLSEDYLNITTKPDSLARFMMGNHSNSEAHFIAAILSEIKVIASKIEDLNSANYSSTKIILPNLRNLNEEELEKWKAAVISAPTVEAIKIQKAYFPLDGELSEQLLLEMMMYDKHGPLDLILYGDGHEEIRKWARNRIREMSPARLQSQIKDFYQLLTLESFKMEDLLNSNTLRENARALVELLAKLTDAEKEEVYLDSQEKISKKDACRSLSQLIDDLGEAVVRCASRQTFLSTSLFLFLASNELSYLLKQNNNELKKDVVSISKKLLINYLATTVLIEKQIQFEKIESKALSEKLCSIIGLFKDLTMYDKDSAYSLNIKELYNI